MRFRAAGVSSTIRVPAKTIPVAPVASQSLGAKTLSQLESSAAAFFELTLTGSLRFFGRFPRSTGRRGKACGFLTRFDCWALEASKRRLMLYAAGPGPLAACTLSPNRFWFGKHVRTRKFLRNAWNGSEPLAASRFRCGSKYVSNYNYDVITYVYWFKNGTVSVSICHTACVISWYNMFALCNAKYHLGQLTSVSQKLSFTVSTLLSWKLPVRPVRSEPFPW